MCSPFNNKAICSFFFWFCLSVCTEVELPTVKLGTDPLCGQMWNRADQKIVQLRQIAHLPPTETVWALPALSLCVCVPVQSPAPWAGPPSFTCFTKIVSIGSRRFLCLPSNEKARQHKNSDDLSQRVKTAQEEPHVDLTAEWGCNFSDLFLLDLTYS